LKICIVGAAGTIGSFAAFEIAIQRIVDELVLIDDYSKDKLEGYLADLSTAVAGLDVQVRTGGYPDMRGADIVVTAAGSAKVIKSRTEVLPQNLPIIKDLASKIKEYCHHAIVITATNPVDLLNYALFLASGLDRKQCLGYSLNDSVRFRMFLAEALHVKSSQIEAIVIGEHGLSQVPLFSSVRVKGQPVMVGLDAKRHVLQQIAALPAELETQIALIGRTQGWATSVGLSAMCQAIRKDSGEIIPTSVVLEGEYGYKALSLSVPVAIGKDGLHHIEELKLEPEEQKGLKNSVNTLRSNMEYVEQFTGKK
jgi:malate dehydrogenase